MMRSQALGNMRKMYVVVWYLIWILRLSYLSNKLALGLTASCGHLLPSSKSCSSCKGKSSNGLVLAWAKHSRCCSVWIHWNVCRLQGYSKVSARLHHVARGLLDVFLTYLLTYLTWGSTNFKPHGFRVNLTPWRAATHNAFGGVEGRTAGSWNCTVGERSLILLGLGTSP